MSKTYVFHDNQLYQTYDDRQYLLQEMLPYGSYICYPDRTWCRRRTSLAEPYPLTMVQPDDLPQAIRLLALLLP